MARPEKNTVDYFPFFVKKGRKMHFIEHKYKNDGYAVWLKLLGELASTNYHFLNLSDQIQLMYLSSLCNVSEDTLLDIINDLVKLGEFHNQLWNEYRILYNSKFTRSIEDVYLKRKNKIQNLPNLVDHLISLGVLKPGFRLLEGIDNTQIKEKKIKLNKRKEIYTRVISYLNTKTKKAFRADSAKTQSLIDARIEEGFTPEDFKKVIDTKTKEWLKTSSDKYLRPETLFGTKFEGYLQQDPDVSHQKKSNFPDGYDPVYESKHCVDPKVLMAYWKHIRNNGWKKQGNKWFSPDYVKMNKEQFKK